jgi:outer membrane biogenesis lipoprotein LolB
MRTVTVIGLALLLMLVAVFLAGCTATTNKKFQNYIFGNCSAYSAPGECKR